MAPQLTATNGFDAPIAGAVNGARDQLLADARLALDQHRNGGAGGFLGGADDCMHARATRDDVAKRERACAAALDAIELARERAGGERIAQAHLQALGTNRLYDEIGRARPHGGDHIVDAAVGGLNDHRRGERSLAHLGEHAKTVEIGHDEIEHDRIKAIRASQQRDCGVAASGDDRLIARACDDVLEQAALNGIIVDDENALGHDGNSTQTDATKDCADLGRLWRMRLKGVLRLWYCAMYL